MHVISSKEETIHLWQNSKHKKFDNKLQIPLGNASAESVVVGVATLSKDTKFSYHNVVKIVRVTLLVFTLL